MNSLDISTDQLRRALQIKEQIESLQGQLNSLLSGGPGSSGTGIGYARRGRPPGGRRTMSPAARARIAAAQRARWAKQKGTSTNGAAATSSTPRKRRKMSAAGRARIIAATKARWARFHAARRS